MENENGIQEKMPSFDEIADSGSKYLQAKSYTVGKRVKAKINKLDKVEKGKFGWRGLYLGTVDGTELLVPITANLAKVLRDEYGIRDWPDLVDKTVTFLVSQGGTALKFEVADCK